MARVLRGLDSERRVAARAAAARDVVLHLHFGWQREELAERIVCAINQRLRDAMATDSRETPFAIGRAEFSDERIAVAVVASDVERGDTGGHLPMMPEHGCGGNPRMLSACPGHGRNRALRVTTGRSRT